MVPKDPIGKVLHKVEFYPAIEDFVYISDRINSAGKAPPATTYFYYAFLTINVIVFPVFLWFSDRFILGTAVFLVNLIALIFVIPRVNTDSYRKYFEEMFGKRCEKLALVELSTEGLRYSSDGAWAFWPWYRIHSIEERDESIYFFEKGNGFAIRKSGFAYSGDERAFITFAKENIDSARVLALSS